MSSVSIISKYKSYKSKYSVSLSMQGTFSNKHSPKNQKYKAFQIIFQSLLVSMNKRQRDLDTVSVHLQLPDLLFSPAAGSY